MSLLRETIQPNNSVEFMVNGAPIQIEIAFGRIRPQVGYLGPEGTYTEEAAEIMLGNYKLRIDEFYTGKNPDTITATDQFDLDLGVVPVENAIEGEVFEVWKQLLKARDTQILAELILPIRHMFIGRPGEEINEIYSHLQALGQCSDFLKRFPNAKLIQTDSTAGAVGEIKQRPNAAAIASKRVAKLQNMPILEENIGDSNQNATRFYLIGRGETQPTGDDITTALLAPFDDRIGLLHDCLGIFRDNRQNLSVLRTYPTGKIGQHYFLASFGGHYKEDRVQDSITRLEKVFGIPTTVLGSYKRAEIPVGVKEPGSINGNAHE